MPENSILIPTTRREFLRRTGRGLGFLAFSSVAPGFLAHSVRAGAPLPEKDRSILVLIQLAGGNDGLNTVVPYADDHYYRLRPSLGLKAAELHKLDDHHGLHPACRELHALYKEGTLGIIQNVGYPNPNRSHFRSMEIWETAAESNEYLTEGWIGRYFDNCCSGSPSGEPLGLNVGNELPDTFLSRESHGIFSLDPRRPRRPNGDPDLLEGIRALAYPEESNAVFLQHAIMDTLVTEQRVLGKLSGYKPMVEYPAHALAKALSQVAGLIASGMETRVYFVSHGGFDTHANQASRHRQLLAQLSSAMQAFQKDLEAHGLQDQVLTMTFSEFGRRPSENASNGTDHGTAAPHFVMGTRLRGGLHGSAPDLDLPKNRDLSHTTDFRSVYSSVLRDWFDADPGPVMGRDFPGLDFLT